MRPQSRDYSQEAVLSYDSGRDVAQSCPSVGRISVPEDFLWLIQAYFTFAKSYHSFHANIFRNKKFKCWCKPDNNVGNDKWYAILFFFYRKISLSQWRYRRWIQVTGFFYPFMTLTQTWSTCMERYELNILSRKQI